MQQRLGDLEKQSETLNNEITDLRQKLATAPAFNTAANGNASVPASPVATTPVVQTPAAPDINKKA